MDKTLTDALAAANHYGLTDRDLATMVELATVAHQATADASLLMTHPDQPGSRVPTTAEAFEVHKLSGWTVLGEDPTRAELDAAADLSEPEDGQPKGNASHDEWAAYGLGHGLTAEDVKQLTRDEIRDHFTNEES